MWIRPPRFRGGWHEVALDVIGRHSGRLNISSAVILDDFRSLAPDCDLPDSEILSLMFNESATRSLSLKLERPLQDSVKNVADLSAEHLKLVRAAQSRLERKKTMSRISDMEKLSPHPEETDRDKAGLHDAGNKSHDLARMKIRTSLDSPAISIRIMVHPARIPSSLALERLSPSTQRTPKRQKSADRWPLIRRKSETGSPSHLQSSRLNRIWMLAR